MDEEQKSSNTMGSKEAHSNSDPQTSQSPKHVDKSEGDKFTEVESQNIESEIKGIQSDNTYKTRNYSISGHLNSSSTQKQNEQIKKYRGDREKLLQLTTFSCQDQKDFAAAGPSQPNTYQQRTAANNPSHYVAVKFICPKCEAKFKNYTSLKMHLLNHKEYTCTNCGRLYHQMQYLKKNLCPILIDTFTCHLCKERFAQKAKLDLHMLDHISEGCVKCNRCARWFPSVLGYQEHQQESLSCGNFMCRICEVGFKYAFELKMHRIISHNRPEKEKVKLDKKLISVNSASSSCSKSAVDFRAKIKSESDMERRTSNPEDQSDKSFHPDSGSPRSELKASCETQHDLVAIHSQSNFTQKGSKPNEDDRMDGIGLLQSILSSLQEMEISEFEPSHKSTDQPQTDAQQLSYEEELHLECRNCSRPFSNYRDLVYHCTFCKKHVKSNEFDSNSDFSNNKTQKNVKCERCLRWFAKGDDCKKHMVENPFCCFEYKCPICLKSFTSSELLQEHSTIHHEN